MSKVAFSLASRKFQNLFNTPNKLAKLCRNFQSSPSMSKVDIFIVYYSLYGHTHKLAEAIKEGASKVSDVEVHLYQVPETLPSNVLKLMNAPPKPNVPVIEPHMLPNADGILFGLPTRFGMMPSQMKAFFDSTGSLWSKGELVGKPAGMFFSTSTQNGGQETTALTAITQLVHHGMAFVPIGYSTPLLLNMNEIKGGSPYGAGTLAGADGSRMPSELELAIARHQGQHFAEFVKNVKLGKDAASKNAKL